MNDLIEDIRKKSKEVPDVPAPEVALKLQMVSVELLSVDPEYQRKVTDTGRKKIAKMVSGFDWSRFGALSVSQDPDNSYLNVTDGQHRLLAARVLGVSRVPCVIGQGDQCKQAADFVAINTVRSGVPSIDKFRARVVAQDETAVKVDEVLRELEITTDVVPGYVRQL
ncbi:ParB N-terminal domain-containing protein [uncultured Pelagimonas sp.]|uniref:ParB N-terminal domain-containing protein n=1 Tax=uncultured Pelagimonas sp. TaxID=1618102 RepID=UPI00261CCB63|nr:ParB N-terminal domain-containing protein [uncultured Pelagimonas sp.]